ncbi:hypothetical protein NUT31_09255 [Aeromonas sp. BC14]|uniref:hypothetical protein n=1 Tax=Aeromonas TaxID=642 RepID=UPI0014596E39|nr:MULTISPECIES: hypothetical protein [Aeromonas]ELI6433642.1 hypothetical protein [Aeromonas salmonicida subsp. salmonicida]NME01636.1 hypothetical protein [Aeromonas sp. DNRA1]UBH27019.1 hypothetical protein LA358_16145 [Aeromonas enteropelogenes]UCM60382.1 hypothetical protein LEO78_14180 [Aeromonas hydrophila]WAF96613.1 hypothetical protein NUT31_09255 [Aeromonas sp. BC14]
MNTTIFSLVGLVVGAVLKFLFSRHLENKKHQRDLRAKAYANYLLCVSEHANLGHQRNSNGGRQLGAKTADSKCIISLYGAPAVISAFAYFELLGAAMNTNEQCSVFTNMMAAMRKDALGSSSVAQANLEAVLLGSRRAI